MFEQLLGLASLLLVGIVVYVAIRFRFGKKKLDQQKFRQQWNRIGQLYRDPKTIVYSVIEADKLLDNALKQLGFKGETMGERLKSAAPSLTDNDAIWAAHKLRNRLVHEDGQPKKSEIRMAIKAFEQALRRLGAL